MKQFTDIQLMIFEKPEIACEDVVAMFGDYADEELALALRDRVDEHIAGCEKCQAFKSSYLLTVELAHDLRKVPDLEGKVQERLRRALNRELGLNLPVESQRRS